MTFDDPTHGHDDTAMINGVVNKVVARLGKQLAKTLKEDEGKGIAPGEPAACLMCFAPIDYEVRRSLCLGWSSPPRRASSSRGCARSPGGGAVMMGPDDAHTQGRGLTAKAQTWRPAACGGRVYLVPCPRVGQLAAAGEPPRLGAWEVGSSQKWQLFRV